MCGAKKIRSRSETHVSGRFVRPETLLFGIFGTASILLARNTCCADRSARVEVPPLEHVTADTAESFAAFISTAEAQENDVVHFRCPVNPEHRAAVADKKSPWSQLHKLAACGWMHYKFGTKKPDFYVDVFNSTAAPRMSRSRYKRLRDDDSQLCDFRIRSARTVDSGIWHCYLTFEQHAALTGHASGKVTTTYEQREVFSDGETTLNVTEKPCSSSSDCSKAEECTSIKGKPRKLCRSKCDVLAAKRRSPCDSVPDSECRASPEDGSVRCVCASGFVVDNGAENPDGKNRCLQSCRRDDDCDLWSDVCVPNSAGDVKRCLPVCEAHPCGKGTSQCVPALVGGTTRTRSCPCQTGTARVNDTNCLSDTAPPRSLTVSVDGKGTGAELPAPWQMGFVKPEQTDGSTSTASTPAERTRIALFLNQGETKRLACISGRDTAFSSIPRLWHYHGTQPANYVRVASVGPANASDVGDSLFSAKMQYQKEEIELNASSVSERRVDRFTCGMEEYVPKLVVDVVLSVCHNNSHCGVVTKSSVQLVEKEKITLLKSLTLEEHSQQVRVHSPKEVDTTVVLSGSKLRFTCETDLHIADSSGIKKTCFWMHSGGGRFELRKLESHLGIIRERNHHDIPTQNHCDFELENAQLEHSGTWFCEPTLDAVPGWSKPVKRVQGQPISISVLVCHNNSHCGVVTKSSVQLVEKEKITLLKSLTLEEHSQQVRVQSPKEVDTTVVLPGSKLRFTCETDLHIADSSGIEKTCFWRHSRGGLSEVGKLESHLGIIRKRNHHDTPTQNHCDFELENAQLEHSGTWVCEPTLDFPPGWSKPVKRVQGQPISISVLVGPDPPAPLFSVQVKTRDHVEWKTGDKYSVLMKEHHSDAGVPVSITCKVKSSSIAPRFKFYKGNAGNVEELEGSNAMHSSLSSSAGTGNLEIRDHESVLNLVLKEPTRIRCSYSFGVNEIKKGEGHIRLDLIKSHIEMADFMGQGARASESKPESSSAKEHTTHEILLIGVVCLFVLVTLAGAVCKVKQHFFVSAESASVFHISGMILRGRRSPMATVGSGRSATSHQAGTLGTEPRGLVLTSPSSVIRLQDLERNVHLDDAFQSVTLEGPLPSYQESELAEQLAAHQAQAANRTKNPALLTASPLLSPTAHFEQDQFPRQRLLSQMSRSEEVFPDYDFDLDFVVDNDAVCGFDSNSSPNSSGDGASPGFEERECKRERHLRNDEKTRVRHGSLPRKAKLTPGPAAPAAAPAVVFRNRRNSRSPRRPTSTLQLPACLLNPSASHGNFKLLREDSSDN